MNMFAQIVYKPPAPLRMAPISQGTDPPSVPSKIVAEIDSLVNKMVETAGDDFVAGDSTNHATFEKVDSAKELPGSTPDGVIRESPAHSNERPHVPDVAYSEEPQLQNTASGSNEYVPGVTSSEFDSASVVVKSGTSVIYLTDSEMSSTDLFSDQDVGTTGRDELCEDKSDLAVVPDVAVSKGTGYDSLVETDSQVSLISKTEIKGNKILDRVMVRDEGYEGDIEGASSAREDSSAVEDEPDSLRESGLRFRGHRGHGEGEEADENDSDEYVEDGSRVMVTTEVSEVSFEHKEVDEDEIGMMEVIEGENDEDDLELEPVNEGDRKLNIIEEVWESIFTPGVNGRVQFFFNVFFFLLFGTLISTLAMVGETMHVSILLGVAIGLFILLQWFFSELAKSEAENQQPVEEEEKAPNEKEE
ncbi:hypothetical protein BJ742DRAFT_385171 [Cladochytrium replicatum]|nr:hypothetical protein BJ742DRAFT_385171 [Cladochytrium replicatum]